MESDIPYRGLDPDCAKRDYNTLAKTNYILAYR